MKGFFKRGDLIVTVAVLTLCLVLTVLKGFGGDGARYAVVYEGGEITHRIELSGERTQTDIKGATLVMENGRIRYTCADCPDKICEKTGWLEKPGDTAACVPNRTVVTIE